MKKAKGPPYTEGNNTGFAGNQNIHIHLTTYTSNICLNNWYIVIGWNTRLKICEIYKALKFLENVMAYRAL